MNNAVFALRPILVATAAALILATAASAQQPVSRLKGKVTTERGEPIANADVRVEAFFGYAAGPYAGQRTFSGVTNARGEWSILGLHSGIWLFEVTAPGRLPETVALPIHLMTTISPGASGLMLTWQLVLKVETPPQGALGEKLLGAANASRTGNAGQVKTMLEAVPDEADADHLAAAGRVALLARDLDLARAFFVRAFERDPSSYRAALGIASVLLLQRDFEKASRAFDAAHSRTHDKDEQKFLSAALADLATIRVR